MVQSVGLAIIIEAYKSTAGTVGARLGGLAQSGNEGLGPEPRKRHIRATFGSKKNQCEKCKCRKDSLNLNIKKAPAV